MSETDMVVSVPESKWYRLTLECGHAVYSRVRLRYEKPHRQTHSVRCPQCKDKPTSWVALKNYEAATDAEMSNVRSGTSYVLPSRIMRLDDRGGTAIPFPYTSRDRDV